MLVSWQVQSVFTQEIVSLLFTDGIQNMLKMKGFIQVFPQVKHLYESAAQVDLNQSPILYTV